MTPRGRLLTALGILLVVLGIVALGFAAIGFMFGANVSDARWVAMVVGGLSLTGARYVLDAASVDRVFARRRRRQRERAPEAR